MGRVQRSPTEVHHVKSGYSLCPYLLGKAATCGFYRSVIHISNKLRPYPGDEDVIGFHNAQATWEAMHGPDLPDFLDWVSDQVAMLDPIAPPSYSPTNARGSPILPIRPPCTMLDQIILETITAHALPIKLTINANSSQPTRSLGNQSCLRMSV